MNKKDIILSKAEELFGKNGFDNTSMNEICKSAGVSKGVVYHHFESKNEMLKDIFNRTTDRMKRMNTASVDHSPIEQLVSLIENFFEQLEKDRIILQLNLNIMFQPSTRSLLKEQLEERSSALFDSVKDIFDRIDKAKSQLLSFILIAELDGVALDYLLVFDDYPLAGIKEALISKYQNLT